MKVLPFCERDDVVAALSIAVTVIRSGGIIVVPTESFYGLAADPHSARAVAALCEMKQRPSELGLPVLCADWSQVDALVHVPSRYRIKLGRIWPAPLSVVLRCRASLPAARESTLAVRIPGHSPLRALLYRVGPLTGTSANCHGAPPHINAIEAATALTCRPDLVLDSGPCAGGEPSTMVDLTARNPRVLRSGSLRWNDLEIDFANPV